MVIATIKILNETIGIWPENRETVPYGGGVRAIYWMHVALHSPSMEYIHIRIIYICVCVVSTFSLGTWNGHWRVANLTVLFLDYILHLFGRELMLFFGATRYHSCSDYWGDCRLIQMTWMHMDDFVLPTPCVFVCLQSSWVPDISRCDSSKL